MDAQFYVINVLLYFIISVALLSVVGNAAMMQYEFFVVVFIAATMYAQYYLFGWYV